MSRKTRKARDDWVIAIPSYRRATTLKEKTLAVLRHYRISSSMIHIFVANEEEAAEYRKILHPDTYHKIIIGIVGLAPQRNFIRDYFPAGKKIVEMDDDITGFVEFDANSKRHERPLQSLLSVIRRGFSECERHGAHLWGVYPVPNGFFMKDSVSTDLKFIIGSFWGMINSGKKIQQTMSEKEDYHRTLQAYTNDGVVVRLNYVSPKTAYYREPGGMQTDPKRLEKQEKAVKELLALYPHYVRLNPNRKSGFPEIRLRATTENT